MDISHVSLVGARSREADPSVARSEQLERAFKRLSLEQRAVLVVHHFLELRNHEAEEVLGIRGGTLESRLNRATRALRAALEAEERQGIPGTGVAGSTAHDGIERRLGEWFHTEARERAPSSLLDAVSADARRLPLRRTWRVALRRKGTAGRPRSRRAVLRRLSVLVAVGSLLVVGLILAAPQRPPRLNVGWLAYVHEGDIYIADPAGEGSRRIAHGDGVTFLNVAWSPDGSRLAAEADSGTILVDPQTGATTFVGGTRPAWSPDGQRLAVVEFVAAGSRMRIVDVTTLSTVRTYPFSVRPGVAWSPNGRWIAATGECSGSACPPDLSAEGNALIRIDVVTGEVIQLDPPSGQNGTPREPAWSPDSRQIAFVRWDTGCGGFGDCGADAFVVDADGSHSRQLNPAADRADQPTWSPDGSWISWRAVDTTGSTRQGRTSTTSNGITVEHPDGTGKRLIAGAGTVGYSWGPGSDRMWLAVQASGATTAILWEAPLIDPPGAVDVSLDPASLEYWPGGLTFDWQPLAKGRTAAVLQSPPAPTPAAELGQITPAPAAAANPAKRWPTLRTFGADSCSLVSVSVGSPDVTTIANFCDPAGNGWSGSWSPTGSAVAIVQGGALTIYRADGHRDRLIDNLSDSDYASWSPDGTWLSVSGVRTYVLRPDGSDIREVPGIPSWSPDSRTMAMTRADGVLLVGPSEGPGLVALGSTPAPATWSPDGSHFGFIRDGNLWTVAIDGSDARNLTALPLGGASGAAWSPDGRWIAVFSSHGIWLVSPTGGGKSWLDFGRTAGVSNVSWAPDSKRLAIETYVAGPESGQNSRIYLVDPNGSPIIRIDDAAAPNWSPDGRYLLVANQQPAGGGDLGSSAVMNADGTGRFNLPAIGLDMRSLVWVR
jgi:Tol biopolymer transport system component